jgi:Polyketide cyclase / dehydrase and lipid transport
MPLFKCLRMPFLSILLAISCCFFQSSHSLVNRVGRLGNADTFHAIRSSTNLYVTTANPLTEQGPRHATSSVSHWFSHKALHNTYRKSSRFPNHRTSHEIHEINCWIFRLQIHQVTEARLGTNLNLPVLTKENKKALALGERVQMQYRDGRSGRGMVVLDVHAPPEKVFELLTRFSRYESFIPTVRSVTVYGTTEKTNSVRSFLLYQLPLHTASDSRNSVTLEQFCNSFLHDIPTTFTGYVFVVKVLPKG